MSLQIQKKEIVYKVMVFLFLYLNIAVTFSAIYLFLDIVNVGTIISPVISTSQLVSFSDTVMNSLFVSTTILLTEGADGIISDGLSRIVMMIEATIGFLLPALIMFTFFFQTNKHLERQRIPWFHMLKRFLFISFGALCVSFGLKSFLIPNQIIDGGIVGISMILSHITGLKLELFLLLLNLPFLYIGYKRIGKAFVLTTLIGIGVLSIGTSFLHAAPSLTQNPLFASIFGGVFLGIGVGTVIRFGGSLDGTEIIGILLNRKTPFSIGKVVMFINVFIFGSAGLVFGWDRALYSLLVYAIAFNMIDITIEGFKA